MPWGINSDADREEQDLKFMLSLRVLEVVTLTSFQSLWAASTGWDEE